MTPTDLQAEASVLSLLMATGQTYRVTDRLVAEDFYDAKHRTMFQAILAVDEIDAAMDTNTVDGACKQIDSEWDDWSLIRQVQGYSLREYASNDNLELFATSVADASLQRQYLAGANRISDGIKSRELNGLSVDVFVASELQALNEKVLRRESHTEPFHDDEFESLTKPITTASSGFTDVDKYTNGLCAPDLFVLTGPSGTGKTTLAMNMVAKGAHKGDVSAIFSMEMSRKQLWQRLIASEARIELKHVQQGDEQTLDAQRQAHERLVNDECLYVNDHSTMTVSEIKSEAMKVKHRAGRLDVIVVDYLTRMRPENQSVNRNEQVGTIARGLKSLAKQLDCCVLCLAQLNRQQDIRDSGEVNHEADVILNLQKVEDRPNVVQATAKKSRHTEPGSFFLTFQGQYNRFENHISVDSFSEMNY